MPKVYNCVACSDTKINSKGGLCSPCVAQGRIKPEEVATLCPTVEETEIILYAPRYERIFDASNTKPR